MSYKLKLRHGISYVNYLFIARFMEQYLCIYSSYIREYHIFFISTFPLTQRSHFSHIINGRVAVNKLVYEWFPSLLAINNISDPLVFFYYILSSHENFDKRVKIMNKIIQLF